MPRHRPHRTRRAAARARRRLEAAFWDDATQLFHSSLDLATILPRVAQLTTRILGDSCTIFLYETDTDTLVPAATYHPDPAIARARNTWLRTTLLRRDLTSHRPGSRRGPARADPRCHDRPAGLSGGWWRHCGARRTLPRPSGQRARVRRILQYALPGQAFTARDILLAMAVADRAASAIAHAQSLALERQRQQQLHTILEIHREITGELEGPTCCRCCSVKPSPCSAARVRSCFAMTKPPSACSLGGGYSADARRRALRRGRGRDGAAGLQQQGRLVDDYESSRLALRGWWRAG